MSLFTPVRQLWRKTRTHLRHVWQLSLPYFRSEERWRARFLLLASVALNLGMVYVLVLLNDWNRVFYDALQNRDATVFWEQLQMFGMLATAFIVVAVYRFYLTQLLEIRWRAWMTRDFIQRWSTQNIFYQLELRQFATLGESGSLADNPDQRIQEDIQLFTSDTVGLSLGLLDALVTLGSFVGILWGLSGSFEFSYQDSAFTIPGFMVWMALLYALLGSLIGHFLGRSMSPLNFTQQRLEANFRHHLMRVREYSEAIALDRGADFERVALQKRFAAVVDNFLQLLKVQKRFTWFSSAYGQAAVVFPMLVAAPRYFSGAIQLGELMQISSAFGQVQESLSWLVSNYSRLASWTATTQRLHGFLDQMETIRAISFAVVQAPTDGRAPPTLLRTSALTITLPDRTVLLDDVVLEVRPGDSVLIRGPSGSGKSTLLRVLAGIWPYVRGWDAQRQPLSLYDAVALPADCMFVPQRPYFPEGRLRDALCYPGEVDTFTDVDLQQALMMAVLPQFITQLDKVGQWSQQLSGGEAQRLAMARVFLRQPHWVFADEATSALDEATEKVIYERLLAMVKSKGGALVSVAHRPSVAAYHQRLWQLVNASEGSTKSYVMQVSH
ncbi:MAG: ABC transporter ATP-binding protein/permease [Betaproteobacteria bacterium]|nr:ABC transporter ATP-binding protein/permease [Betaproteobacteria bacterium]